jgi:hypothetical protein
MQNISHFSWVKFTYLFLAQPLSYWYSFRTLEWETLLILKAGKYGKRFFSVDFGKFPRPCPSLIHAFT